MDTRENWRGKPVRFRAATDNYFHYWLFWRLIVQAATFYSKNAHYIFKVTASSCFFCSSNSPKPRDSSFTIINDNKRQPVFTVKKLETASVWGFGGKITESIDQLPYWFTVTFLLISLSDNRLITAALDVIRLEYFIKCCLCISLRP